MKRRLLILVLVAVVLSTSLSACGNKDTSNATADTEQEIEVPEDVRKLQHKIDKALESNPSYEDLLEIKEMYDDLLNAEQEMIENYDEIEKMFKVDSNTVACVFAVNKLKDQLKNPSSLEIISAKCYELVGTVYIWINYSASNSYGGTVESDYYCVVDNPTEENGQWSCKLDDLFATYYRMDILNAAMASLSSSSSSSNDSQEYAERMFQKDTAKTVDPKRIMDNIDMYIYEIPSEE